MGLIAKLTGLFRRKPALRPSSRAMAPVERLAVRRWDAVFDDRLTEHLWDRAHGQSINDDLFSYRTRLLARAEYEASANSMVTGVVQTHATDVVGQDGPILQVQSDNASFNAAVEEAWQEVFAMPDPARPHQGGPEWLKTGIRGFWTTGDFITQEITARREGLAQLGMRSIHARRIDTPPELVGDQNVAFGIRFDDELRPLQYYVERGVPIPTRARTSAYDPVPADLINHLFVVDEPDQVRGFPWLASCLRVLAELREFDDYVMKAAKGAAAQGIVWWTNHPDSVYKAEQGSVPYEPGLEVTGPPGWQPMQVNPTQPASTYESFRHERLRELGRPVNMPLMMVLLSSADSNFSSAHYDGQIYTRGVQAIQSMLARLKLNHYVRLVVREVQLAGVPMPDRYQLDWTWTVPPYVNPKQMYDALRAQLEDGTISMQQLMAMFGRDFETTVAQRERELSRLRQAGLHDPPVNAGSTARIQDDAEDDTNNAKAQTDDNADVGVGAAS